MGPRTPHRLAPAVLALAGVGLLPLLGTGVHHDASFSIAAGTAVVVCDLLTAALLAQLFTARGSARLLFLAVAYLVSGLAVLGDGVLGDAPGAAWLWALGHAGLPAGLIVALWGGPRGARRRLADPGLRRGSTVLIALGIAAAGSVTLWPVATALPRTSHTAVAPFVVALAVAAVAMVARRGRRGDHERWLMLVAVAALAAAALGPAVGTGTLGWYAAHALDLTTSAIVLAALVAEIGRLHSRLEAARDALRGEGGLDPLTAMPSRSAALAVAGDLQRSRAAHVPLAIGVVDVDRLAAVNETYGRLAGDAALRVVAGRVRDALRDEDLVARDDGGGFVLVLPDTDLAGASLALERALEAMRATPAWGGPRQLTVTASAGLALVGQGETAVVDALEHATAALQQAKALGRDRVELAGRLSPPVPAPLRPAAAAPRAV